MKTAVAGLALSLMMASGPASYADVWGLERGTPELASATTLAFGPEDILLIGDAKAATVFAVATGDKQGDPASASVMIDDLAAAIGSVVEASEITVNDLAVNSATGTTFLAVTADDKPVIVSIDAAGRMNQLSLKDVRFASAQLANPPEDRVQGVGRRARNPRNDSITDIAYFEGKILISGLASVESPSTVRELNFPFARADQGVSVEIFHAAHGQDEDYAAMRTFVPLMIDGQPNIVGAYICTPLVRIPVSELSKSGEKVRATTVAELGNRNRPLDMISYQKDGQEFLLLSNSARGVMKITTAGLQSNEGLSEPVRGGNTAGQSYETIDALQGVVQMDKLSDSTAIVLLEDEDGRQTLKSVALP